MKSNVLKFVAAILVTMGLPLTGSASVVFSGLAGTRQASAEFSTSGSNLIVTLSNTALTDVLVGDALFQSDLLSAVFFDLATANPLTLQSAAAAGTLGIYQQNSTVNSNANGTLDLLSVPNLAAPGSTNGGPGSFDGGWQFRESGSDLAGLTQNRGLGTNGLGIFNGGQVMAVANLDYALTSFEDNVATSQAKQLFNFPAIKNSITFSLSGLPIGFVLDATTISNVRFQYGTNLNEPSITVPTGSPSPPPLGGATPEPTSIAVWSLLVGVAAFLSARLQK